MDGKTVEFRPRLHGRATAEKRVVIALMKQGHQLDLTHSARYGDWACLSGAGIGWKCVSLDVAKTLIDSGLLEPVAGAGWSHYGMALTCYRLKTTD